MLTLKRLKLTNFLSHEETEIDFKQDQKSLIDGISGAGKSSIIESIIWVLYGKGRTDNRFLITDGKNKAKVVIDLVDGAEGIRIERSISDAGKQAVTVEVTDDWESFEPIKVSGLRQTQEWIERDLLRASYSLFINSVAYPQDNIENFVKQSASRRKDLLMEIAGSEDYAALYTESKNKLALEAEKMARVETRMDDKEQVVESAKGAGEEKLKLEKKLIELQRIEKTQLTPEIDRLKLLEARKKQDEEKLQTLNRELLKTVSEEDETLHNIASERKLLSVISNEEEVKKRLATFDKEKLVAEKKEIETITKIHYQWTNQMHELMSRKPNVFDYDPQIEKLNQKIIEIVRNSDTRCPSIENMVCPKLEEQVKAQTMYFEDQLNDYTEKKATTKKELDNWNKEVEMLGKVDQPNEIRLFEVNESLETVASLEKHLEGLEHEKKLNSMREAQIATLIKKEQELGLRHKKLEADILKLQAESKTIEDVGSKLTDVLSQLESLKKEMMEVNTDLTMWDMLIKSGSEAQNGLVELKKELDGIKYNINALKAVNEAFGSKGIRTMIIDFFVPRLEIKVNEILSQLSDFRVEIDTQRSSASGEGVIEGLFINIVDAQNRRMEFSSYSGGERLKIVVAISEALASLQKIGFRLLDELFIGLDTESTENFALVLDKVQDRFSQLLVISHLDTIKDLFSDHIEVIKQNGVSTVV